MDKPELETLDYKPGVPVLAADSEGKLLGETELRALDKHIKRNYKPDQPKCDKCEDTGNVLEPRKDSPSVDWEPCPDYPEQPNRNIMIIKTVQNLMTEANKNISKLEVLGSTTEITAKRKVLIGQALEDIDLFQKTTLQEMAEGKAFE